MKRPKLSLLTSVALSVSMLMVSTGGIAGTSQNVDLKNYKGYKDDSCPVKLVLKDGLYFGAAAGYDAYRIATDVSVDVFPLDFAIDPVLSVNGAVGGAFLGYGHYFTNFYNFYFGFEIFGNASAAKTDYELAISSRGLYKAEVEVKSNYGIALLPGFKLNPATLAYVRLGYNWTDIDFDERIDPANVFQILAISSDEIGVELHEDETRGGFVYGMGIEAAFYGNWSARVEYSHTDYSEFDTEIDTDVSPADNQFMLGLIYHFD